MRTCWDSFVADSGKVLDSAEMVFVPVFWEQHYFCVVVNFRDGKVQYLNNREENDAMEYMAIVNLVHKQISIFLEEKNHPKGQLVRNYVVEFVHFPWQSSDEVNDCGVFLMHHMEHFKGESYDSDDDMTKAMVRRVLRAKIFLRIVLSDLNELRSSVINKTHEFCKSKGDLETKIEEKKKADALEKRKEAADKKKQAAEKSKKAAEKRKAEKTLN